MNPFFNREESRPRALIRLIVFIFFSLMILGTTTVKFLLGFEYLFTGGVIFGFFWMMYRFVDQRGDISEAGLSFTREWWREFGIGSFVAALVMTSIFVLQWVSGDIEVEKFAWNRVSSTFWLIPLLGYLAKMLSVGFYEEVLSRSYLIPNIKEGLTFGNITPQMATILAVIISSSLFGVGHINNPNVSFFATINIIAAGFMLALPYVLTGKLSYSVGLHFAWNYFQGGVFGFPVSGTETIQSVINISQKGNTFWTGGDFGPEGGLIGLIAVFLIIVIMLTYINKKEGGIKFHPMFKKDYFENQESLRKADELR